MSALISLRRRLVPLAALLVAGLLTIAPAGANQPHAAVVSADPVDWTPHVLSGTVYAIAVLGDTVYVGGEFDRVQETDGATLDRANLFAFTLGTGRILRNFAPRFDGAVRALAARADGLLVGGSFATANGAHHLGLAKVRAADGSLDPAFTTGVDGTGPGVVRSLASHGDSVYVGGEFGRLGGVQRAALARLDARTGAVDPTFDLRLTRPDGRLWVQALTLSLDGDTLAFDGTFTEVGGAGRFHLAVAEVGGGAARVADWATTAYADSDCDARFDTYLRGLDLSPDGSYLVVVTTGHNAGPDRMCNSAARFDLDGDGEPAWVNRTGGNTLLSVAVTGAAVYVGGHQQWLDNPYGDKSAGPGAVDRPGIGALDPRTGRALAWNPTKDRGVGVQALVAYPGGLLVGSDTETLGTEYHARLGLFPIAY